MLFVHESVIPASVARVFAFHEHSDALRLLTPPWERVEIIQPPTSLQPGTRVILRVHVGPFSELLESEHTLSEKDVLFPDRQLRGTRAVRALRAHASLPRGAGWRNSAARRGRLRAAARSTRCSARGTDGAATARAHVRVSSRRDARRLRVSRGEQRRCGFVRRLQ